MVVIIRKHPCRDCFQCHWCSNDRCHLCLETCHKNRLSIQEQIELYEQLNRKAEPFNPSNPT